MLKIRTTIFAGTFFLLMLFKTSFTLAAQEAFIINMVSTLPSDHPISIEVIQPWINDLREKTNGRIIIRLFEPNTLCPDNKITEAVKTGQIGIGHVSLCQVAEKFPVNMVISLPVQPDLNALAGTELFWRIYNEIPDAAQEFKGIKVLALHTSSPLQIGFANQRLHKRSNLEGKYIFAENSYSAGVLNILGAKPVNPAQPFLDQSISGLDGFFLPASLLRPIHQKTKLHSMYMTNLTVCGYWLGMHQGVWNSLPPDLQRIITQNSEIQLSFKFAKSIDDNNRKDIEWMKKNGVHIDYMSTEENKLWFALISETMREIWLENIQQLKISQPQRIYERVKRIAAESGLKHKI